MSNSARNLPATAGPEAVLGASAPPPPALGWRGKCGRRLPPSPQAPMNLPHALRLPPCTVSRLAMGQFRAAAAVA